MKVNGKINQSIISAATGLLKEFVEELTPTKLIAAIENYSEVPANAEPKSELLTIAETMDFLKLSKPTIYRMFEDGTLTKIKVGRSTRISFQEIQTIIKKQ